MKHNRFTSSLRVSASILLALLLSFSSAPQSAQAVLRAQDQRRQPIIFGCWR